MKNLAFIDKKNFLWRLRHDFLRTYAKSYVAANLVVGAIAEIGIGARYVLATPAVAGNLQRLSSFKNVFNTILKHSKSEKIIVDCRKTISKNNFNNFFTRKPKKLNPFYGKTFKEIDNILIKKGFTTRGPDPLNGKGSYFHPVTNRKYYFDHAGKVYRGGIKELPHVDVHYKNPINGSYKKRYPLGENLYEQAFNFRVGRKQ